MDRGSILIVDDDPVVVQGLGRMLSELGVVRFALSGEQGLQMVRESSPDLILLDAEMPGMSGYDVCRALKADPEFWDIPIIFITGHDDADSELMGLEAGAVDFIGKPPKPLLVSARVRTHLRLKQMSDELRRNANTDPLTGVGNRRQFDFLLDREWDRARRSGAHLSLLMADIDHFKLYNDHYGHQRGDECLRAVAQTILTLVQRPADAVARIGGEEFAVLLPETDAAGAIHVAQRIVEGIAERHMPHEGAGASGQVSVSVGAATVLLGPDHAHSAGWHAALLMQCADRALYAAKHAGRGCSRYMALEDASDV